MCLIHSYSLTHSTTVLLLIPDSKFPLCSRLVTIWQTQEGASRSEHLARAGWTAGLPPCLLPQREPTEDKIRGRAFSPEDCVQCFTQPCIFLQIGNVGTEPGLWGGATIKHQVPGSRVPGRRAPSRCPKLVNISCAHTCGELCLHSPGLPLPALRRGQALLSVVSAETRSLRPPGNRGHRAGGPGGPWPGALSCGGSVEAVLH